MRWQYAVVGLGSFRALDRLTDTLGRLGAEGWELVTVYDKASNWFAVEKGFMLFRRPVAAEQTVAADEWCVTINLAGGTADHRSGVAGDTWTLRSMRADAVWVGEIVDGRPRRVMRFDDALRFGSRSDADEALRAIERDRDRAEWVVSKDA